MKILLVVSVLLLMGCASVGTKYKWDGEVKNGIWGEGKWIPSERYRCSGAGCKVEFESGGKMEGGKFIDISGLQLKNQ